MDMYAAMRIFIRVVERGSMSGAARDLDIGQPAISERIDKLEKHLGARLLMRSARTLTCTNEGMVFYERCKNIISSVEEAVSLVSQDETVTAGTVRIAAPQCFGEVIVPKIIGRSRERFPQLKIDLVLNDNVVDPVTEGVDISLRLGELGQGSFSAHRLGYVDRLLVASPAYLKRHGKIEVEGDLYKHPFIRVRGIFSNERLPLQQSSREAGNAPIRTAITTSHWRPMFELIKAGAGIGVVQEPACIHSVTAGELVRLLPQCTVPPFPLHVLVQARTPYPSRIRAIVGLMKKEVPILLRASS